MLRRIALALPISLVLVACGGSEAGGPPAAAPPAAAAAATPSPNVTAAPAVVQPSTPPALPPPPPAGPADAKKADVAAPGRAGAADAPILGKITQDDVLAAVNKTGDTFNRCYSLGAAGSKTYTAKVTVKATVGPSGAVNTVEVVSSTAKNAKVDACVVEGFKKLSFKRPAGSGATVFTFPLSFDGAEQVP
jgi:TonB family protein